MRDGGTRLSAEQAVKADDSRSGRQSRRRNGKYAILNTTSRPLRASPLGDNFR
jgi:hypothetical protein